MNQYDSLENSGNSRNHSSRAEERSGLSRRDLLGGIAAVSAGALSAAGSLLGQGSRDADGVPTDKRPVAPLTAKGGAIDVHHHFVPPIPGAVGNKNWTPQMSLDSMDKFNIAAALLSLTMQREQFYDGTEKGRDLIRTCNEFGAKCVQKNPKRLGLLAGLPFANVDHSLKEIEYAYDTLKCDGIGIYSSTGDKWPGDPMFEPIMAELNRRKAPVLIHAAVPNCCNRGFPPGISTGELDFDETRCAQSLLVNGTLTKFPDIKFIIFHGGGVLPVMAGRIQDRFPKSSAQWVPNGVWAELRKFYYEVAHGTWRQNLLALKEFVPMSQILFGTDYTPEPIETTVRELPRSPFSKAELQQLERTNAEKLFPRFKL
jgi:predicted TIM-barrel fold metal-dependent hydrolase